MGRRNAYKVSFSCLAAEHQSFTATTLDVRFPSYHAVHLVSTTFVRFDFQPRPYTSMYGWCTYFTSKNVADISQGDATICSRAVIVSRSLPTPKGSDPKAKAAADIKNTYADVSEWQPIRPDGSRTRTEEGQQKHNFLRNLKKSKPSSANWLDANDAWNARMDAKEKEQGTQ